MNKTECREKTREKKREKITSRTKNHPKCEKKKNNEKSTEKETQGKRERERKKSIQIRSRQKNVYENVVEVHDAPTWNAAMVAHIFRWVDASAAGAGEVGEAAEVPIACLPAFCLPLLLPGGCWLVLECMWSGGMVTYRPSHSPYRQTTQHKKRSKISLLLPCFSIESSIWHFWKLCTHIDRPCTKAEIAKRKI